MMGSSSNRFVFRKYIQMTFKNLDWSRLDAPRCSRSTNDAGHCAHALHWTTNMFGEPNQEHHGRRNRYISGTFLIVLTFSTFVISLMYL